MWKGEKGILLGRGKRERGGCIRAFLKFCFVHTVFAVGGLGKTSVSTGLGLEKRRMVAVREHGDARVVRIGEEVRCDEMRWGGNGGMRMEEGGA